MTAFRLALAVCVSILVSGCGGPSSVPSSPTATTGTPASNLANGSAASSIIVAGTPPALGSSSQFSALAMLSGGGTAVVTAQATWTSSNAAVATVSASGLVSAKSLGPVTISATYGGATGSLTVTVVAAATFTVSGTVTEATSGAGIAATVTVKGSGGAPKSVTADAAGRYSIAELAGGAAEVSAAASGYQTVSRTVNILGNTVLNLALPRSSACPAIGFDAVGSNGAPFTNYTSCGLTVTGTTSNWVVSTTYGKPAPFIQFSSAPGSTTTGEVTVTAGGSKFAFQSVDLYSSTTPIPYVFTGISNSAVVFTVQSVQGNTFGNFATVQNPNSTTAIDTLVIRLSNPAAPCCSNPTGLDNIVVKF